MLLYLFAVLGVIIVCALPVIFLVVRKVLAFKQTSAWVSIRVKFLALAGRIQPEMEKERWQFTQFNEEKRSDILMIAFGGGAMALMQIPRAEFLKTFSIFECDKLFLVDPHQSWYLNDTKLQWRGIEEMNGKLADLCSNYKKVLAVGNCLGGSAVLLFSPHFHFSISFVPQVDLTAQKSMKFKIGAWRLPKRYRENFHLMIAESVRNAKGPVHIYDHEKEKEQFSSLPLECEHLKIFFENFGTRNVVGAMKKRDMLMPVVKEAYQSLLKDLEDPSE